MKKKLITMILISMMTVILVGCGSSEEKSSGKSNDSSINNQVEVNEEDEDLKEAETVKLTKDEIIEMNDNSIAVLKSFFDANGMPYKVGNTYNKSVDEAEICLYDREVEENDVDTKNVKDTDYFFMDDYTIQGSISFNYTEGFNIEDSLATVYCKAVTDEDIDISSVLKKLQEYMDNYNERSGKFLEKVESGKFVIEIKTTDNTGFIINIDSKYEVK